MAESIAQTAERIMRQVFEGEINQSDIAQIDYSPHRAYAAVAWLLLHPKGRLDENLYVLGSFCKLMSEVTGRDEGRASNYTNAAGITTSVSCTLPGVPVIFVTTVTPTYRGDNRQVLRRTVRITPPPGLLLPRVGDPIVSHLVEAIRVAKTGEAVALACAQLDTYLG